MTTVPALLRRLADAQLEGARYARANAELCFGRPVVAEALEQGLAVQRGLLVKHLEITPDGARRSGSVRRLAALLAATHPANSR